MFKNIINILIFFVTASPLYGGGNSHFNENLNNYLSNLNLDKIEIPQKKSNAHSLAVFEDDLSYIEKISNEIDPVAYDNIEAFKKRVEDGAYVKTIQLCEGYRRFNHMGPFPGAKKWFLTEVEHKKLWKEIGNKSFRKYFSPEDSKLFDEFLKIENFREEKKINELINDNSKLVSLLNQLLIAIDNNKTDEKHNLKKEIKELLKNSPKLKKLYSFYKDNLVQNEAVNIEITSHKVQNSEILNDLYEATNDSQFIKTFFNIPTAIQFKDYYSSLEVIYLLNSWGFLKASIHCLNTMNRSKIEKFAKAIYIEDMLPRFTMEEGFSLAVFAGAFKAISYSYKLLKARKAFKAAVNTTYIARMFKKSLFPSRSKKAIDRILVASVAFSSAHYYNNESKSLIKELNTSMALLSDARSKEKMLLATYGNDTPTEIAYKTFEQHFYDRIYPKWETYKGLLDYLNSIKKNNPHTEKEYLQLKFMMEIYDEKLNYEKIYQ